MTKLPWAGRGVLTGILAALLLPSTVSAALAVDLGAVYSGSAPAGSPPRLSYAFTQSGNNVQLTLTNKLHTSANYFTDVLFNLKPALNPTHLTFTYLSGQRATRGIYTGRSTQRVAGNEYFDIDFGYTTSNNSNRFTMGETSVYRLSYPGGIAVTDFDFLSSSVRQQDRGDGHTGMAGVAGLTDCYSYIVNCRTPVVPAPDSTTLGVFGVLLALVLARR